MPYITAGRELTGDDPNSLILIPHPPCLPHLPATLPCFPSPPFPLARCNLPSPAAPPADSGVVQQRGECHGAAWRAVRGYRRGAVRRWPARRSGLEGRAEWCGAGMEGHKWSGTGVAGSCAEPAERVFILVYFILWQEHHGWF